MVFDKSADDKTNLDNIVLDSNDHLTPKRFNILKGKRSSTRREHLGTNGTVDGIYALKCVSPSRVNYYFFSEKLKEEHLA